MKTNPCFKGIFTTLKLTRNKIDTNSAMNKFTELKHILNSFYSVLKPFTC